MEIPINIYYINTTINTNYIITTITTFISIDTIIPIITYLHNIYGNTMPTTSFFH